jgi:iron complex outermembrane recepter protein
MSLHEYVWLGAGVLLLSALDAAATDADPHVDQLEEIVVTALRRETKLIDTPVAVTAIGAEDIERERIVDLSDLQLRVPNLIFTQVTQQETFVSIRGTGINNDTPGSDMGVAIFLDGVPRTSVHDYSPEMFDLQSIEVLRGPQGTLFGRNTTGGAVVIRTRDPSFDAFYKARVTYGNYNLGEAAVYVTGPLIGNVLAGSLGGDLHRRDGYVDNVTLNREDGAERTASVRGKLLWAPADDVRAVFGVDYLRDGSESRVGSLESTFVPSLMPALRFGPDFTNEGEPPRAGNTIIGLTGNVNWTLPLGTVTSISGFRSVTSTIDYSPIADPTTQLAANQQIADRQYSQELHFASPDHGVLTWLGGLFYLHVNRRDGVLYTVNPFPGTIALSGLPVGARQLQNQEVLTTSKAAFGEATYHLTRTLGFRGERTL